MVIRNGSVLAWLGMLLASAVPFAAQSQNSIDNYSYRNEVFRRDSVDSLHGNAFGETWDPDTGSLTFAQTDTSLAGQGPTIVIGRNYTRGQFKFDRLQNYDMGDWTLSIPRIETILTSAISNPPTAPGQAWQVSQSGASAYKRCTYFGVAAFVNDAGGQWFPGYFVTDEAGVRRQLLKRDATNTIRPTLTAASNYPAVARDNWQFDCLPTTSNGQLGEGFLGLAPNGTKYYFDYLVGGRERITTYFDLPARQGRQWVTMYVSKVVDRFGNSASYQYTGDRLTSITTNDGRKVALTWRDDYNVISSISTVDVQTSAVLQTWSYEYVSAGSGNLVYLSKVTLPDGSTWTYTDLRHFDLFSTSTQALCGERVRQSPTSPDAFSSVKAPSGATATFGRAITVRAYSHAGDISNTSNCAGPPPSNSSFESARMFSRENGLVSKSISGPGLATQTWTYRYSDAVASWVHDPCYSTNSCVTTRTSSEISPDGARTDYAFTTIQGSKLEGKVLKTQWLDSQLVVRKETTVTYAPFNQGPWPARVGGNPTDANIPGGLHVADSYISPMQATTTRLDGVAFSTTVNSFDVYARPLSVTKASAPSP
ncbi:MULTISPECIES: hypothetical protein [unclassified Pseudoxanthomonas]|uniref:hypothetical protein n=1 Tax=unclassified Pseudoxanthomonas TaxID=2645906 RepID=UPI0008F01AE9|nr:MULTISPECIES: hypothetical protein [unclassified Pseudoxanthomonas]SFV25912.1 hypothetical protein SAMN05428990_0020 [Pseudoxanthomonas sp. YR558]